MVLKLVRLSFVVMGISAVINLKIYFIIKISFYEKDFTQHLFTGI